MKVEIHERPSEVNLIDLNEGDVCLFKNELYMKLDLPIPDNDESDDLVMVLNMNRGKVVCLEEYSKVELVEAVIHVSRYTT